MNRRDVMKSALLGTAVLPGLGHAATPTKTPSKPRTFLLVHGAWHNALHWTRVSEALTAKGHRVVAIDLPGHGLNARFPASYLTGDAARFKEERSPLADVTLDDCADTVVAALEKLRGGPKPVLVGHSAGGTVITRAAEKAPQLMERLVYLSAYVPLRLQSASAYGALPEAHTPYSAPLFIGDAAKLGAVRINPRGDAAYRQALHAGFYHDVDAADFLPFALTLTPDIPVSLWIGKVGATKERWGRIPRSYVRCAQDRALAPALQDLMIREADAFTPGNAFTVDTLDTSHSPFASQPQKLAALLDGLR
ncbi:hydrolase, alpha/beta fold family protein [Corallococcus coralloides DSM 2259]|uniref:Hydrolase, alpha/beta fold family protein n=1 Tax=Corallococcus coralloides (strain ATCC 25202 / DSM 2259 / NBRC 100086 / M2) TaxID=1144275 RepID=H8MVS4_CORCM|nr:alpha/beta fold hydrolase [Corallococcus coralloides]AFE08677.1 hydrolase, alpha/beta fold family protein [Corallococcus coralloides DSM 2259]